MSIKIIDVDKNEFSAKIATIYCDESNLKMAEIIIRPSEQENYIEARWSDKDKTTSGTHMLKGKLSCSPIDTATQKTAIIKSVNFDKDGKNINRLVIKKI